jgi:hypothetical protein
MDKEDGRKLSRQAQHERRKQAVRLHRQGMAVKAITAVLGIAQGTGEWSLVNMAWNIKRMHVLRAA